jgi:bacterioferritin
MLNIQGKRVISMASIQSLVKRAADESAAPAPSNTKSEMLAELIVDMQKEYGAAIQYINHAAMIDGAEFDFISRHILEHAQEEFDHAKALADRIQFLGGNPAITIETVKVSGSAIEMLKQDLEGENDAIARYRKRIVQAESIGDFGTSELIRGILADEESHKNELQTTLRMR